MDLAIIDPSDPIEAQAEVMAHACETLGFFRLPLSVIPRQVADDAWETAAAFFALDEREKRLIEFPQPGYPYGYSPFRYETLAKSLGDDRPSAPDLKESLSVGPDCGSASHAATTDEAWIRSPSLWPDRPAALRDAWTTYYRALSRVAEDLLRVMAVALGLPAYHFEDQVDRAITSMRALHYPAIDNPLADPHSLRAGAHSDYGTLTILRTDDVPGLEVRQPSGLWSEVEPDPDTFVVNLGDSIAQWTNDRWRSTVHRVVPKSHAPRQSMAFFHMANWDAVIECLPGCSSPDDPPQYPPVAAGPWLMQKFTATVT